MTSTDTMERHAVISEAAYIGGNQKKLAHIDKYYPNEYSLIDGYTNKEHVAVQHNDTGKIILGVRGTDFENTQGGKLKDLATDALVTFGLHKLSNRYKRSDKHLKKMIDEYGKENISITGHSLGGSIVSDLSHKHDIESHSFNRGGSHATFGKNAKAIHPKHRERAKRNHVYLSTPSITKGFDPLSLGTAIDPMANIHFVKQKKLTEEQQSVVNPHSIGHFHPKTPPRRKGVSKRIRKK